MIKMRICGAFGSEDLYLNFRDVGKRENERHGIGRCGTLRFRCRGRGGRRGRGGAGLAGRRGRGRSG